jgi:FkbM family methyltransferase
MSTLRRAVGITTDLACQVVGREHVVRAARFVLWRARLDVPNDMYTNGESSLQRWILNLSPSGRQVHVIDVGANVGRWSISMLGVARRAGRLDDLDLHAFEPSSYTFTLLSELLREEPVCIGQVALGDRPGLSTLHVAGPGAGTNSLHRQPGSTASSTTEEVSITTLDIQAESMDLGQIALVKIDTEGHDLAVLRGARRLLTEHRISIVQFEYNHRWIYARSFLRDAFELLGPLAYRLGKLTPHGVEFYPEWDADLETFVEGNYVACLPEVARRLPSVPWWKSASRKLVTN